MKRSLMLALVLAVTSLSGCAHRPSGGVRLPLEMAGSDGSWAGVLRGCALHMSLDGQAVSVERPSVLDVGASSLLLNSLVSGPYEYVNLNLNRADCVIGQRHYEYRVDGCFSDDPAKTIGRRQCIRTFRGCADTAGPGRLKAFVKASKLPSRVQSPARPAGHPYSCREDWRPGGSD